MKMDRKPPRPRSAQPLKIAVATPRFAITGVPLAQVRFARALAARGHHVTQIVGWVNEGYQFPETPGLDLRILHKPKVRQMLWPMVQYMRQEKPDIIFSAEDHLNTILLLAKRIARSPVKISGSSRVTPFDTYSRKPFTKRWVLWHLARWVNARADALTCVSRDMVEQYRQVFRDPPHVCVYNIVDDAASRLRMIEAVDHPWLTDKTVPVVVAAGSLAPWKGFDVLLDAMAKVVEQVPARLLLLGDGPQRAALTAQVARLGLEAHVDLVGYVENPLKYFSRSDVFVLSSRVEGLPNVLVEAMMCGCTPVSTDCPTGPREVLENGKFGALVPVDDANAMASAIVQALETPQAPAFLAQAVRPFEEETVIEQHFAALGL
jgi:glycosyltransferase involved in cell wall biosynthesis